jgi:hypothetical protein
MNTNADDQNAASGTDRPRSLVRRLPVLGLLAAAARATVRAGLAPLVSSLKQRAAFATAVILMWFGALCFGLVALTLCLATWTGPIIATAVMATTLAAVAAALQLIHLAANRPPG